MAQALLVGSFVLQLCNRDRKYCCQALLIAKIEVVQRQAWWGGCVDGQGRKEVGQEKRWGPHMCGDRDKRPCGPAK